MLVAVTDIALRSAEFTSEHSSQRTVRLVTSVAKLPLSFRHSKEIGRNG